MTEHDTSNGTEVVTQSRFCVLKLDESDNWSPEVTTKAKRVFSLYLFDASRRVHCCEFTPSYECTFLESQWHNPALSDREADRLDMEIRQQDIADPPVRYFHCHQIDGLPCINEGEIAVGMIDLSIDHEEEALEYVRHFAV